MTLLYRCKLQNSFLYQFDVQAEPIHIDGKISKVSKYVKKNKEMSAGKNWSVTMVANVTII